MLINTMFYVMLVALILVTLQTWYRNIFDTPVPEPFSTTLQL